jgi:hypothetical protein
MPCNLPATPNAAVQMQRFTTPKHAPSLPAPTRSRPSTAAGSSLPPHNISGRIVPSVEFFAASEKNVAHRQQHHFFSSSGADGLERCEQQVSRRSVAGKQRGSITGPKVAPGTSNDPIIQLAASIFDSSHGAGTQRDPTLGSLQQELSRLQAHRAMELHRLKSAMQHPPANLLMRERNLPEAEPSANGQLELSLRNRCARCMLLLCVMMRFL